MEAKCGFEMSDERMTFPKRITRRKKVVEGEESDRQKGRGATRARNVFLYSLCEIGSVGPHVQARALDGCLTG